MRREIRTGVHLGDGPPPGYQWNVWVLEVAFDEAMKFLDGAQYDHLAEQMQDLAKEADPSHSLTVSVDAVDDFHELRDKGGVLGGLNVRVFFCLDKPNRAMVVLGANTKQNNGPTPFGVKKRIERRRRRYFNGEYGHPPRKEAQAVKAKDGRSD